MNKNSLQLALTSLKALEGTLPNVVRVDEAFLLEFNAALDVIEEAGFEVRQFRAPKSERKCFMRKVKATLDYLYSRPSC
jgi:hypothetical protein